MIALGRLTPVSIASRGATDRGGMLEVELGNATNDTLADGLNLGDQSLEVAINPLVRMTPEIINHRPGIPNDYALLTDEGEPKTFEEGSLIRTSSVGFKPWRKR